jgi:hypothetical protein
MHGERKLADDWKGRGFLIEHRKMGLGVFAQDVERDEPAAQQLVIRIRKAVRAAQPFFEWLAGEAVSRSALNVVNNASSLIWEIRIPARLLPRQVRRV